MELKNVLLLGVAALPLWGCVAVPEHHAGERHPHVTVIEQHRYPSTRSPGIDAEQDQQRRRIQAGVRSGELTRAEADRLAREQAAIKREEYVYKSDGRLTERERAELRREQAEAERNIRRESKDAQDADRRYRY